MKFFQREDRDISYEYSLERQEIVVLAPTMEEQSEVIDYGRRQTVVLNLKKMEDGQKQRVMDFICGAAYTLNLQITSVSRDIYLIAPEQVEIFTDAV